MKVDQTTHRCDRCDYTERVDLHEQPEGRWWDIQIVNFGTSRIEGSIPARQLCPRCARERDRWFSEAPPEQA